jgi:hypothetical protein
VAANLPSVDKIILEYLKLRPYTNLAISFTMGFRMHAARQELEKAPAGALGAVEDDDAVNHGLGREGCVVG